MANLKEVRYRISSTIGTQQITKAMKLVSATKLRKATMAITQMRPYATKLQGILSNLTDAVDDEKLSVYFTQKEVKNILIVAVSSDRGLCGAFNANIAKKVKFIVKGNYEDLLKTGNVHLLPIGKKAYEMLKKTEQYSYHPEFVSTFQELSAKQVFNVGEDILAKFRANEYDKVIMVYNRFVNAATQIITAETLLPVLAKPEEEATHTKNDYIFEPSKVEILEELIPRTLKTQLYKATLDSFASEHGARMVSMDKATENAGELLKNLKIEYNKARQAAITNEISEIVGGAAALEN